MTALPNIIRISLLTLLVITPWLFGGVWARVQWVLMLVVAVLLAIDLISRFGHDDRPNLIPTAWLPLLAGIGLGVFQLVSWPPMLANWLAPESLQWRREFLTPAETTTADIAEAGSELSESGSNSSGEEISSARTLYPVATREYLALLCLGTAVFVLASLHLIDKQSVLWFLSSIAVCGAALAFFGLVQRLSWNGKFYWVFEPLYGGFESFGPFVNRNNAGGFLNLCLAAGLGLLVWAYWARIEGLTDTSSKRRRRSKSSRSHSSSGRVEEDKGSRGTPDRKANHDAESKEQTLEGTDWSVMSNTRTEERERSDREAKKPTTGVEEDQDKDPEQEKPRAVENELAEAYRRASRPKSRRRSSSSDRSRRSHRKKRGYSSGGYSSSYDHWTRSARFASVSEKVSEFLGDLTAQRVWVFALVVFTAGGVFCTASRGSILSMFIAMMVTCAAFTLKSGNRNYALALMVVMLAGASLMSWAGQSDFVQHRFDEMFDEQQMESGRIPNWIEALRTVPEFWIAGTGLGTYRFVYERFQFRYLRDIAHFHAENQYVQALVEGGVLAFTLLCVAIVLTTIAIIRLYKAGGAVNTALAITGTFALTSQVVGGTLDFGLYIPSNMVLMAAICGAVIGRAALLSVWPLEALDGGKSSHATYSASTRHASERRSDAETLSNARTVSGATRSRRAFKSHPPRTGGDQSAWLAMNASPSLVTLIVGILLLGCLFGSLEMNKAAKIEVAMRNASLDEISEMDDPDVVSSIISPLALVLPQRWDDALAHRRMAELNMQLYRATTYQQLLAEKEAAEPSEPVDPGTDDEDAEGETPSRDEELWIRSAVWHLHRRIRELQGQGDSESVQALVDQPLIRETLLPAAQHALLARQVAPTVAPVHLLLAELSAVHQPGVGDDIHLVRARTLAPGDASMKYWSGLLHLNSGRKELASELWNESLNLSPIHLHDIMASARGSLTVRELLDDVLPPRSDLLLRIALRYFGGDDKTRIRDEFLKRAEQSLDRTDIPLDELAWVTATIYRLQGRPEDAVPFYEDAVSRNGSNLQWRFEYARLLIGLEEYDKALEQATYLTMSDPNSQRYMRLYEEINSKRYRAGAPRRTGS